MKRASGSALELDDTEVERLQEQLDEQSQPFAVCGARHQRERKPPLVSVAVADAPNVAAHFEAGKLPIDVLARLLDELPPPPAELRLGPAVGEDACAIDVACGTLVAATDPITLTAGALGLLSVIVNANDVAVTGARPRWFLSVILLPPRTGDREVAELFTTMNRALGRIGAHLAGGHTEITPAVTQPIVIGQMLGMVESNGVVATGGARPGDLVVQVGPAPIEGAAVLAHEATERLVALDPHIVRGGARGRRAPGHLRRGTGPSRSPARRHGAPRPDRGRSGRGPA